MGLRLLCRCQGGSYRPASHIAQRILYEGPVHRHRADDVPRLPHHLRWQPSSTLLLTQYIFSLWKLLPDYLDIEKWIDLKSNKLNRFQEMISNLKAPQYFYDMVVQLMVNNQGKVYFRVVDTIFWFFNDQVNQQ